MRSKEIQAVVNSFCQKLDKFSNDQLNGLPSTLDGLSSAIMSDLQLRNATRNFDELFNKELNYLVNEI